MPPPSRSSPTVVRSTLPCPPRRAPSLLGFVPPSLVARSAFARSLVVSAHDAVAGFAVTGGLCGTVGDVRGTGGTCAASRCQPDAADTPRPGLALRLFRT